MNSQIDLQACYRAIPSVQSLLQNENLLSFSIAPKYLKQIIQEEIDRFRQSLQKRPPKEASDIPAILEEAVLERLNGLFTPGLQRVINGSGIVLHTNMGRAPLADVVSRQLTHIAGNYNNLELEVHSGKRGSRHSHVEELLCLLTGAEAAIMVNNCAAAILLTLTSLCRRKEVPISRGELVEIGGSFRMPDVMKASGAKMVEIGTTNKTHLTDYRDAIGQKTAALLKVHTSNYRVQGFTKSVGLADLTHLAHQYDLPLIYDMGGGILEAMPNLKDDTEPLVRDILDIGVDVITFSGDKMLGGPQAGIIAGKRRYIDKIRKNHLARALRCDKLIYSAMEATLRLYLEPQKLRGNLPVVTMLNATSASLQKRAKAICSAVAEGTLTATSVEAVSQVGSGAFPLHRIPSVAIQLTSSRLSANTLAVRLRKNNIPIISYIHEEQLLINLRTVFPEEDQLLIEALIAIQNGE